MKEGAELELPVSWEARLQGGVQAVPECSCSQGWQRVRCP